jgi:glycogen(starch) synthase
MRIALVTCEYPGLIGGSGGLAAYTQRTARALLAQGHDVTVFAPAIADGVGSDEGVPLISVSSARPGWLKTCDVLTLHRCAVPIDLLYASWRLEGRVRVLHRERPFDVVHYAGINGLGLFRGPIPAVARASCHRRTWTTLGDGSSPGWHSWLHERIEERALRRMDQVFAPSRGIAVLLSRDLGCAVPVLPNPWTPPSGPPGELPAALAGTVFVLFAGTLCPLKGARTLGEAMRRLTAERPGVRLVVAGRRTPEGEAACAGLGGRMVGLGLVERAQLRALMRAAAVVVVPSLADNLPNVALEAMAEGAPVVASAGLGLEDLDGGRGLVACVPPGNAAALVAALRDGLDLDDAGRQRLAGHAIASIAGLGPEHSLPPLIALYRQAITGTTADGRP